MTVPELTIQNPSQPLAASARQRPTTRNWHRIVLGAIIALSAFLNFYRLDQMGYSNTYYAAGVKSMLTSWHNFFFVSFDPGGFVTIDKPPLGFWIQAASAKLFGFSGWSILFPEALAGVLAVALLYHLVRRTFGPIAGLIAALALAVTPVSVATQRNNTIDSLLVFTLLLSAWALIRAIETGRLRWLLLCALGIGLGFNIKMMEAYLVVPAFGLAYLLGTSQSWLKRILHLGLALILMLAVSFAWIVAVDLTPASQRPFVGSTQDNSELSLALGYNGVQRLLGMGFGGGGGGGGGAPHNQRDAARQAANQQQSATPQANNQQQPSAQPGQQNPPNNGGGPGGGGPGGGGAFGIGQAGLFRLFTDGQLSGQIAWMLPLALIGLLVACWQERVRLPLSRKQWALILWGVWLLTTYAFFSVAGFFHPYYLITFGPAVGALVGIGIVTLWNEYQRQSWWRALLLPLALIITAAVQVYLLVGYPQQSSILTPVVLALCVVAIIVLLVMRFLPRLRLRSIMVSAACVGLLAVLIAPTTWAAITVQGQGQDLPSAGPSGGFGFGGGPGGPGGQRAFNREGRSGRQQGTTQPQTPQSGAPPNGQSQSSSNGTNKLEQFLLTNQGNTRFILAVPSSQSADSLILATSKPVMALGGFSGSDPILTQKTVAELVANNTVRFFLLSGGGGFGGGPGGGQSTVTSWVTSHCTTVSTAKWESQSQGQRGGFGGGPGGGSQQLYDCSNAKQ